MMAMWLLAGGALLAQGSKVKNDYKSFLFFHGGPSFPVGDFASKSMSDNANAGFANTGFNFNLDYGYRVQKNIGFTASIFYNKYKVDEKSIQFKDDETNQVIPVNMDHWQFYGISAGPMFSFQPAQKIWTDLKIMGGIVNANAPMIRVMGMDATKEEWKVGAILQAGVNLRFDISNRLFISTSADYLYMDPKFKYSYTDLVEGLVSEDFHQKMTAVNVTAGIGVKF